MSLVSTVITNTAATSQEDIEQQSSHCTHRQERHGVAFVKPVSAYCISYMSFYIETSFTESPGQRVSTQHIASLVGTEFPRARRIQTAINGFENSGLDWTVYRDVVTNADFCPVDCHRSSKTQPQNRSNLSACQLLDRPNKKLKIEAFDIKLFY